MQGEQQTQTQSMAELVNRTIEDTKKLVKSEIELSKQELLHEAREAARGGGMLAAGIGLGLCGLGGLVLAFGLALPTSPARGTLLVSTGLITSAVLFGGLGMRALPKHPFAPVIDRVERDIDAFSDAGV